MSGPARSGEHQPKATLTHSAACPVHLPATGEGVSARRAPAHRGDGRTPSIGWVADESLGLGEAHLAADCEGVHQPYQGSSRMGHIRVS